MAFCYIHISVLHTALNEVSSSDSWQSTDPTGQCEENEKLFKHSTLNQMFLSNADTQSPGINVEGKVERL